MIAVVSPLGSKTLAECIQSLSRVGLFVTSWTIAHQASLFLGFSRQEYWNGLPFSPPGDPPNPGVKPVSPVTLALAGGFFTTIPPGKPQQALYSFFYLPEFF